MACRNSEGGGTKNTAVGLD
uniref:Uncharacterized protein n=1 Tax=Anguilla anguilla TaxID=7936 RepID=A0A0E9TQK9_ANGAN